MVDRGSSIALRRSTLDSCLGGQRFSHGIENPGPETGTGFFIWKVNIDQPCCVVPVWLGIGAGWKVCAAGLPLSSERGGNVNYFEDFRTENGSSQGQDLALTGLGVPFSLDSGYQSI